MKRIMPLNIEVIFLDTPESQRRIRSAYFRIFTIAKQNLLAKKHQNSTEKNFVTQRGTQIDNATDVNVE